MEIYESMMSDYHSDTMDRSAMLEQLKIEGLDEYGRILDCEPDFVQWKSDNEEWVEEETRHPQSVFKK